MHTHGQHHRYISQGVAGVTGVCGTDIKTQGLTGAVMNLQLTKEKLHPAHPVQRPPMPQYPRRVGARPPMEYTTEYPVPFGVDTPHICGYQK